MRVFGRPLPSLRLRRGKPPKAPDGTMPLMEHLHELRRRLFIATLAIGLGTVVGFIWFGNGIPAIGLPSLSEILTAPYCAVPASERVTFGDDESCKLLATGPFSALELQLKSALIAGVVLSVPVWLYQLWAFVTPALYSQERRYAVIFVSAGAALFVAGAVLAYVVIREGLTVLLGFGG
ncbi:MAG TPA: twin-arginine translocase subunit TatC, partial [Nakamurella sp.]